VQSGIDTLAQYFRHPGPDTRQAAVATIDAAMAACRAQGAAELITDLHLIHTCLLDPAFDTAALASVEENGHAA
jgi:hypothetical protein